MSRSMVMRTFAGMSLIVMLAACGVKTGKNYSKNADEDATAGLTCGEENHSRNGTEIRLKGTALLSQALSQTLGPQKDINVNDGDEHLLETYSNNFGNTNGLSFGEIYADVKSSNLKMTGYMMALNIIAYNAALRCASEKNAGLCQCDTEETAAAMLGRAIPYRGFCSDENDNYVEDFAALCKENGINAISALISSTAFAIRN
jgi:hypothetical protein